MAPSRRKGSEKKQSNNPNVPAGHVTDPTLPQTSPRSSAEHAVPATVQDAIPAAASPAVPAAASPAVPAAAPPAVRGTIPAVVSAAPHPSVPPAGTITEPPNINSRPPAKGPRPTTSKSKNSTISQPTLEQDELSCKEKFRKCLYDREKGLYCGRTCKSWLHIISYSIMYFIFLTTYMLFFLFITLLIIKSKANFKTFDKGELLTYSEYGIGLTATPTSESSYPLIWYRNGEKGDYEKYIKSIDKLLLSRHTRDVDKSLGQCGQSPYGYGSAPCVIVRINKQLKWTGQALSPNSTLAANAPKDVKDWVGSGRRMLWLHCGGYHPYDKEHIGGIRYYPNPPGFDPALFPLDVRNNAPLVAVQFSSFTEGISLAIECKLWHEHGPSSVEFVIYVEPRGRTYNLNISDISQ